MTYAYTPPTDNCMIVVDGPSTSTATSSTVVTNQQNYDTNKEIDSTEELGAVGGTSPREENTRESKENLHELNEEANLALQQQQRNEDTNYENTNGVEHDSNTLNNNEANANNANVTSANAEENDYRENATEENEQTQTNVEAYNDSLSFLRQLRLQRRQEHQRLLQQEHFNLENNSSSSSTQFDSMQSIASIERKDCEYLKLVQQFRSSLVLPDTFFQASIEPICFCTHCNAQASEKLHGWVYFKLNQQTVNSNSSTQHALDSDLHGDWLPLFYMTRVDKIRAILDHGQPLPMDTNGETHNHASGNQKDEPGTRLELHFTPNSTAIIPINQQHKYHYNGQAYKINTAFEVYVRRQSICASSKSTANEASKLHDAERRSSTSDVDLVCSSSSAAGGGHNAHNTVDTYGGASTSLSSAPVIKDQTWFTKEAGACVITALILKLDKLSSAAGANELY